MLQFRPSVPLLAWLAAASLAFPIASEPQQHGVNAGPLESKAHVRFPDGASVVDVPFRHELNKILVDVSVGGSRPLSFVLDTGAPATVILKPQRIEGISLEYYGQAHVAGAGSGGARTARLARGATLDVGGLRIEGAGLVVLPELEHQSAMALAWDGILGAELFSRVVVEVDWERRTLRLHDPSRYQPPAGAEAASLPLENRGGHVFVACSVTIDGQSRPVRLVVDTGASHALSLRRESVPLPRRRLSGVTLGRGLGGVMRGDVGRVDELSCGGASLRRVVTGFGDASGARVAVGADGNLGAEVLRRFRVTFDYSRGLMRLQPTAAAGEPFLFPTSGMQVEPWIAADGSIGIDDVHQNSPATRAGLAVGDRIVAVDAQPVRSLGVDAVRARLSQAPGTRVKLQVVHAEGTRAVELQLEDVL